MPVDVESPDHWPRHASQWSHVGAPLRPSPEDATFMQAVIGEWHQTTGRAPAALVLGVTPELARLDWPPGARLFAVDRAPTMIAAVWPRDLPADLTTDVRVGDWRRLPIDDAAIDLVVGDGAFSALVHADYAVVGAEVARVTRPGARVALRSFMAPHEREDLAAIAASALAGRIQSFHTLKWRLAMALQPSLAEGIAVGAIHRAFVDTFPDRDALARAAGWRREAIDTIDAYVGMDAIYTFPSLPALDAAFAPTFARTAVHVPAYELGERCPTVVFARALA